MRCVYWTMRRWCQTGGRRSGGLAQSIRAKSYGFMMTNSTPQGLENETIQLCSAHPHTRALSTARSAAHLVGQDSVKSAEYAPRQNRRFGPPGLFSSDPQGEAVRRRERTFSHLPASGRPAHLFSEVCI